MSDRRIVKMEEGAKVPEGAKFLHAQSVQQVYQPYTGRYCEPLRKRVVTYFYYELAERDS